MKAEINLINKIFKLKKIDNIYVSVNLSFVLGAQKYSVITNPLINAVLSSSHSTRCYW